MRARGRVRSEEMAIGGDAHQPVLLSEAIQALGIQTDGLYLDATFGRGGHSRAILAALGPAGRLWAMDRDPDAVAVGRQLAAEDSRFGIEQTPFSRLGDWAVREGLTGRLDAVLMDLGLSSPQLDNPERGFSFLLDGPLDMRMNPDTAVPSAAQWLAVASEAEIARVLWEFGEERFARRIAGAIVRTRIQEPLLRTSRLASLIAGACPTREPGKHPATRSFQAIRIHINQELQELAAALAQCLEVLRIGGRLVVISFHSLEDRLVKRFIRAGSQGPQLPKGLPVPAADYPVRLRALGSPQRPADLEVRANPRSRSAILRAAERLA